MQVDEFVLSLQRITHLIEKHHFQKALQFVDTLLGQNPVSPTLWLKRAMLIQLQDADQDLPPLDAVRESLVQAIEQIEPADRFRTYNAWRRAIRHDQRRLTIATKAWLWMEAGQNSDQAWHECVSF